VCTLIEILPFIQVIVVVIWEFHLQPAFDLFLDLEPVIETLHVHLISLYVGEVPFVQEEFADAAELSVVMPKFSSALYSILPLCIN
jgi:hypothetical protein